MRKRLLAAVTVLVCLLALAPAALARDPNPPVNFLLDVEETVVRAKVAALNEDRTPLSKPVSYNILWIGYTHVTYGQLDFRMTNFDRDYLKAVTRNFEKYVEKATDHSLDIHIDLCFIDDPRPLTKVDGDDWLLLARETVLPDIGSFMSRYPLYDTVLTTVQTDGEANERRNAGKPGYGVNYVMLGVETHGLESDLGYSTFVLGVPREGTWPLKDPEIPSLYATAVAVHEWLHQLEYMGELLGIEYPETHVYQGGHPGYRAYTADENNYDYFEFYELVLKGMVPYTGGGDVRYVGMYPAMWRLVKRDALDLGIFTIRNSKGEYLYADIASRKVTLSDKECRWKLRYAGDMAVIISPAEATELRLDLDNAWDAEGNRVKLHPNSGFLDAQRWLLYERDDGTCSIRTFFSSHRPVTVEGIGGDAQIRDSFGKVSSDAQDWFFDYVPGVLNTYYPGKQ